MNKRIIGFIINLNLLSALFLPDDLKLNLGSGYNTNFLNFSNYEINKNDALILGDSDTYDSPVINLSIESRKELEFLPILLDLDLGLVSYTQSKNKTSFNGSIIVSHRLGNYSWIKIGYHNNPRKYLRMYKDKDQIDSPLLAAHYL